MHCWEGGDPGGQPGSVLWDLILRPCSLGLSLLCTVTQRFEHVCIHTHTHTHTHSHTHPSHLLSRHTPQTHPGLPSPLNSSQGVCAAGQGEDGRGGLITGLLPFRGLASSLPDSGPASDSTPGQGLSVLGSRASSSFRSLVCPLLSHFPSGWYLDTNIFEADKFHHS